MINLTKLYTWLEQYIQAYYTEDQFIMERVLLKQEHSKRVADNAVTLARNLGLTARQQTLAETIGLLHDVARFRQITEYRTFVDADSFDHGDVGVEVLAATAVLQEFSPAEQETIRFAIKAHNKMLIPPANDEQRLFAKIIRDADKLDILRILPPIQADHNYSPKMIKQLKTGGVLSYTDVLSLADKRLIRLSWFYDIYFDWTLQQLVADGLLQKQLDALPSTPDCQIVRQTLHNYVAQRLAQGKDGHCER